MSSCARGPPLRTTRPTHVADVRLADVEYVGAIGDSISTGFNARNQRPLDMLTSLGNLDDLGVAFSTGADADAATLPGAAAPRSPPHDPHAPLSLGDAPPAPPPYAPPAAAGDCGGCRRTGRGELSGDHPMDGIRSPRCNSSSSPRNSAWLIGCLERKKSALLLECAAARVLKSVRQSTCINGGKA